MRVWSPRRLRLQNSRGFLSKRKSVFVGGRQRQIDDAEQGEDERLYSADEKIEKLNEERNDRSAQREVEWPNRDTLQNERGNDDEEQLTDKNVEEQARGQGYGPHRLVDQVDEK